MPTTPPPHQRSLVQHTQNREGDLRWDECTLRRGGGRTAVGARKVVIASEQANIKEADIWRDWHRDKQCLTRRRRCAYHRLTLERLIGWHNSKTLLLTTSISTVRGCVNNLLIPEGMMALKPAAQSHSITETGSVVETRRQEPKQFFRGLYWQTGRHQKMVPPSHWCDIIRSLKKHTDSLALLTA